MIFLYILNIINGCDFNENKVDYEATPWAPFNNDMTIDEVKLKDERTGGVWFFNIPKAYYPEKAIQKGFGDNIKVIQTGLPDLEPRRYSFAMTADIGTNEYKEQLDKKMNGLKIYIFGKTSDKEYQNRVIKSIKKRNLLRDEPFKDLLHYTSTAKCTVKTKQDGQMKKVCRDRVNKDFFIRENIDEKQWVVIECLKPSEKLSPACIAETSFDKMKVIYFFSRKNLERWEEFHEGTHKILKRFYQDKDSSNINGVRLD